MRKADVKTPRGPRDDRSFWKGYLLPKVFFFVAGFPKDAIASIDITNKCNLRCRHCYFFADEGAKDGELTDHEWLNRFKDLRRDGRKLRSCTWVGGEPLLKKDLIEEAMKFFQFNLVVTNGSIQLPNWPNVYFHVSVDGPRDIHDKIRGEGSYERLKNNIMSDGASHLNISLACCLTKLNASSFEALLEEWYPVKNVKGVLFDFFTPVKGVPEDLWISFDERDKILDRLIDLKKKKYKDFIGVSERTLQLMKSDNRQISVGKNCIFRNKAFALDASGKFKSPCMIGPGADCDKCGCIVPFYLKGRTERRYILKEVWGDITSCLLDRGGS